MNVISDRLHGFADLARSLGPMHAVRRKLQDAGHRVAAPRRPYALTTKAARFPLWCRPGTSDELVFWQVFVDRQYAPLVPRDPPRFILDVGANVGYTSAYFLTRFPGARVFAIEPDPGNAALLRRNVAPYSPRVTVFETGLWSHRAGLVMETTPFRDGREWARQVREAAPGETPAMRATDIATLLGESGEARISILKMDIEGAEAVVFSADCSSWLPRVDAVMVEVHDAASARAVERALGGPDFAVSHHGELTMAQRHQARGSSMQALT